ncbi:hypothetical protein, partial [Klebsiella michiganensis]|uniref:hypothetical protein n=1 Tax=Klebsiella michiganensis TaxID=1134687 RepID=UPI001BCF50BC
GKGKALEIPHSPEKKPVSCLTDWHYLPVEAFFLLPASRYPSKNSFLTRYFVERCHVFLCHLF